LIAGDWRLDEPTPFEVSEIGRRNDKKKVAGVCSVDELTLTDSLRNRRWKLDFKFELERSKSFLQKDGSTGNSSAGSAGSGGNGGNT